MDVCRGYPCTVAYLAIVAVAVLVLAVFVQGIAG